MGGTKVDSLAAGSPVKRKKKKSEPRKSYFELQEEAQKKYRDCRVPRRVIIPEPPPPGEEEVIFKKAKKSYCKTINRYMLPLPRLGWYNLSIEAEKAIKALGINRRMLRQLHWRFDDIDTGGQGQITKQAFWQEIGVTPSTYTDKLFDMIDSDKSGMMDFSEFLCILVTYCIFNRDDILRFAFDCFDVDGSGAIDRDEASALIEMLNEQDSKFIDNIRGAQEQILGDEDGFITFEEFRDLSQRFPLMLQPAFELQDKMHMCTLGLKGWVTVMENIAHAEKVEDAMAKQFGRPLSPPPFESFYRSIGAIKKFAKVDTKYINGMRPSRHMYVKEEEPIGDIKGTSKAKKRAGMAAAAQQDAQAALAAKAEEEYQAASETERKRRLGLMGEEEHLALEGGSKDSGAAPANLQLEGNKELDINSNALVASSEGVLAATNENGGGDGALEEWTGGEEEEEEEGDWDEGDGDYQVEDYQEAER